MKRKHLALLPLAIGMVFGAAAQAETINFQGTVINNTCVPNVENTGSPDGAVTLPLISSNLLPINGSVAGMTPFTIGLTGCDTTPHTIKAYFWQPNAQQGRLVKNPGAAGGTGAGWQYEILNAAGTNQILVGQNATVVEANNADDPGAAIDATGSGTLNYNVRYYRVAGAFQTGTLNATATYVLFAN